jgi:hypothetical protein
MVKEPIEIYTYEFTQQMPNLRVGSMHRINSVEYAFLMMFHRMIKWQLLLKNVFKDILGC